MVLSSTVYHNIIEIPQQTTIYYSETEVFAILIP